MPNLGSPRRPIVAGNWKMNTTIDEGLALVDALRPLIDDVSTRRPGRLPAVRLAARHRRPPARLRDRRRRAERLPRAEGRLHRRGQRPDADRAGPLRHRRALGAAAPSSARTTRSSPRRSAPSRRPACCRSSASARRWPSAHWGATESVLRRQVHTALDGLHEHRGAGRRLRAGLGDRDRPRRHRRGRQRGMPVHPRRDRVAVRRGRRPGDAHPVRRQRQRRERRGVLRPAGHRRRAGRRRQPGGGVVRRRSSRRPPNPSPDGVVPVVAATASCDGLSARLLRDPSGHRGRRRS